VVEGHFDATFLAAAGVDRLGVDVAPLERVLLDPHRFVPAPGQGALAFTARERDRDTAAILQVIDDPDTRDAVVAERAVAYALGGSCFLPVGAFGVCVGDRLEMVATVASPEGDRLVRDSVNGSRRDAVAIGAALGSALCAAGGAEIVEEALRRG